MMLGLGSFWLPVDASSTTQYVDHLFNFIFLLCTLFFILIVFVTVLFAFKYRRKSASQRTSPISGNHKLELIWSVIPGVLLVIIFAWGFRDYMSLRVPPRDALEIRVTGVKWAWSFTYPVDGIVTTDLVVPEGRPVKLIMVSQDVLHSFFVPAFRIKQDVVPHRYSVVWFEATKTGNYNIFCTEYCGTGHSQMLSQVKVLSGSDYQDWIDRGGEEAGSAGRSSVDVGKHLYKKQACYTCHSIDGTSGVGPTFQGLYGSKEKLESGDEILVDDNFIRKSIIDPGADVTEGFPPVMPTYKGRLNDKQITALIDYLKSIGTDKVKN